MGEKMDFSNMNFDELEKSKPTKKSVDKAEKKDFSLEGFDGGIESSEVSANKTKIGTIILIAILAISCFSVFVFYALPGLLFIATSVFLVLSIKRSKFELFSMIALAVLSLIYMAMMDFPDGGIQDYYANEYRQSMGMTKNPSTSDEGSRELYKVLQEVDWLSMLTLGEVFLWIATVGFIASVVLYVLGVKLDEKFGKLSKIIFFSSIGVMACVFIFIFPTNAWIPVRMVSWSLWKPFVVITIDMPRSWLLLLAGFIIRQFIHNSEDCE